MRTVLLVEDSFVESYELEYRLKELGYAVEITATLDGAQECLRKLDGRLAGIICDNKLIRSKPIATMFYDYTRSRAPSLPFIVYSAFPPQELPKDDPFLAVITKPSMDDAINRLRRFASVTDSKQTALPAQLDREAA